MLKCRKNGSTRSFLRRKFPRIQSPATDASTLPTAGIETLCILDIRLGVVAGSTQFFGAHNKSKNLRDDTCGCAMRGLPRGSKGVRSSSGPSSTRTAILWETRGRLQMMRPLWPIFQHRSERIILRQRRACLGHNANNMDNRNILGLESPDGIPMGFTEE